MKPRHGQFYHATQLGKEQCSICIEDYGEALSRPAPLPQEVTGERRLVDLHIENTKGVFAACEAEIASKNEQIGKLYRVCNERDVLRNALSHIANHELRDHEDYEAIQEIAENALKQPASPSPDAGRVPKGFS